MLSKSHTQIYNNSTTAASLERLKNKLVRQQTHTPCHSFGIPLIMCPFPMGSHPLAGIRHPFRIPCGEARGEVVHPKICHIVYSTIIYYLTICKSLFQRNGKSDPLPPCQIVNSAFILLVFSKFLLRFFQKKHIFVIIIYFGFTFMVCINQQSAI